VLQGRQGRVHSPSARRDRRMIFTK
jgi:hypothetical protein